MVWVLGVSKRTHMTRLCLWDDLVFVLPFTMLTERKWFWTTVGKTGPSSWLIFRCVRKNSIYQYPRREMYDEAKETRKILVDLETKRHLRATSSSVFTVTCYWKIKLFPSSSSSSGTYEHFGLSEPFITVLAISQVCFRAHSVGLK